MKYGKRICLYCGKEFEAEYASQITCSRPCRRKRENGLKKASYYRLARLRYDDLEWANGRLEEELCARKKRETENAAPVQEKGEPAQTVKEEAKQETKEKEGQFARQTAKKEKTAPVKTYRHICANCGSTFKDRFSYTKFCSDECARASAPIAF